MKIALLMGGHSREREVSIKSGKAVELGLKKKGHEVDVYEISDSQLPLWKERPQIVFLALHGGSGENGEVQKELEKRGIPYTGSPPRACKLSMDKVLSKTFFQKAGLSTPNYSLITPYWQKDVIASLAKSFIGYPCILKPVSEGSSIGVFKVEGEKELLEILPKAFEISSEILMEKYIEGREFTVAILDEKTLPIIEVRSPGKFFDYDAKYASQETQYILDPQVSEVVKKKLERNALLAHSILGCRHFSRVDMILDSKDQVHILEINTLPGMTAKSLLPMAAQKAGINFPDLCEQMALMAWKNKKLRKAG
ncbi:MAG: D-alanine--D-alanine ligase [Planctomycetota bacterium]|nr:MAG: D-alanine--D-alanine ligase [Planctomycetota bacterium]